MEMVNDNKVQKSNEDKHVGHLFQTLLKDKLRNV